MPVLQPRTVFLKELGLTLYKPSHQAFSSQFLEELTTAGTLSRVGKLPPVMHT